MLPIQCTTKKHPSNEKTLHQGINNFSTSERVGSGLDSHVLRLVWNQSTSGFHRSIYRNHVFSVTWSKSEMLQFYVIPMTLRNYKNGMSKWTNLTFMHPWKTDFSPWKTAGVSSCCSHSWQSVSNFCFFFHFQNFCNSLSIPCLWLLAFPAIMPSTFFTSLYGLMEVSEILFWNTLVLTRHIEDIFT